MLRLRERKMLLGMGRRGLDPRWMGLPPTTGHWPAPQITITSKKSPPVVASSRPPPALWGGSPALAVSFSSTVRPPHADLQLPSPSDDVLLPSPPASPRRRRVEKANCSRPFLASFPSSEGAFQPSPSAGVRVPSPPPRPGVPLLSAPTRHAGSIVGTGTENWFWPASFPSTGPPPPFSGPSRPPPVLWGGSLAPPASCLSTGPPPHAGFEQLPSPGNDVPLPSRPENPARSHVGKTNCSRPSSASCPWSPYDAAGVLVPSPRPDVPRLSAPASQAASSIVGTDTCSWPPLAWCPSTPSGAALKLLAPGARVPLPSYGRSGAGTGQSWQPPQRHVSRAMGVDRLFSALCLSTGLTPLVPGPGAGVSLRSATESPAHGSVPSMLGSNCSQQLTALRGSPTRSRVCVSRAKWQLGSSFSQFSNVVSTNVFKSRAFSSSEGWKPVSLNDAPQKIMSTKLQVNSRLERFKLKLMNTGHFLVNFAHDSQVFSTEMFDVNKLQKLYYDLVRDLLISNGVIIDDELVHDTYLRDLYRKFQSENQTLMCITALDLMRALVPLPKWKWPHLLNYIRDEKIMVLEWWNVSLATIETMPLTFGWKLDLGDDRILHKGIAKGAEQNHPIYSLYSVIWEQNDVKDLCISLGVKCASLLEAELLAVYLVQQRGIQLKVQDLMVTTSQGDVDKALREANRMETDKSQIEDLCMLVVGLKSKFQNLFCQEEAIEQLLLPEVLSKIEDIETYSQLIMFEYVSASWSDRLAGLPLFRIHKQDKSGPMAKFLGRRNHKNPPEEGKLTLKHVYKVQVESESQIVDAVRNILMSMLPKRASLSMDDEEKAQLVINGLETLGNKYRISFANKKDNSSAQKKKKKKGNSYTVLFQSLKGSDDRELAIICGSSVEDVIDPNMINVRLLVKGENDDMAIQNLAPECFFFYNGANRLEIGENIVVKPEPKPKSKSKSKSESEPESESESKSKSE